MIIRRKHTANFTTIGNALFNDERLAPDEVGILAYLLSRPHDWEVRRPALARRWRIGRDAIKRIMLNLIVCGWVVAKQTRLPNGTFHTIYEVRDEPGPSISLEEAKAATSLVSSDADPSESDDSDDAAGDACEPERVNDPPDTGQPDAGQPDTANPSWSYKSLQKTDSVKTESPNGARAFSDVSSAWPKDHILSDVAAAAAFAGLIDQEKSACIDGISHYLTDCREQNRKVCDLTTYIREKRWKRFEGRPKAGKPTLIKPGTAQWHRWKEYYEANNPGLFKAMETFRSMGRDVWAPSEWPPGKTQSSAA